MRGGGTSLDKSVFFRTQQGFEYGYGKGFRDPNTSNLDKGIFKANEDFETSEQRDLIGIVSIHVDDLSISGSGIAIKYIAKRTKSKSRRVDMEKTNRRIWVWKSQKQTMGSSDALFSICVITKAKPTILKFLTNGRGSPTNR